MKQKKCKNCKGKGYVPVYFMMASRARGIKECPVCKGTGKIVFLRGGESEQKTAAELEEIKKLKELSKKYKGCRCSQYCSVWNSEDGDCEIMGSYHLSPSRCRWFLMQELRGEGTVK